jgi:GNAT superfamily N-acetyltransferase
MHARCSLQSRIDRWRAPLREIPPTYLADALTGRPGHFALVSRCGRHGLVALGSAVQNAPGLWELGVLVDDGHQRRGIGSAMVAALICSAQTRGARRVLAEVGSERRALLAPLSQFGTVRLRLGPDCITGLVDLPVDEDGGRVGRGTAQSP